MVHLRIADKLLDSIPGLSPAEFVVGNIAPDSGVPNGTGQHLLQAQKSPILSLPTTKQILSPLQKSILQPKNVWATINGNTVFS